MSYSCLGLHLSSSFRKFLASFSTVVEDKVQGPSPWTFLFNMFSEEDEELRKDSLKKGLCLSLGSFELSCQQNPLVVNVTHNLSQPFFLTTAVILNFSSPFVAVTGVALRTSCHFSAFALTRCAEGGVS